MIIKGVINIKKEEHEYSEILFTCPIYICGNLNKEYFYHDEEKFYCYQEERIPKEIPIRKKIINEFIVSIFKLFNLNYKIKVEWKKLKKGILLFLNVFENKLFLNELYYKYIMKNYRQIIIYQMVYTYLFYKKYKESRIICEFKYKYNTTNVDEYIYKHYLKMIIIDKSFESNEKKECCILNEIIDRNDIEIKRKKFIEKEMKIINKFVEELCKILQIQPVKIEITELEDDLISISYVYKNKIILNTKYHDLIMKYYKLILLHQILYTSIFIKVNTYIDKKTGKKFIIPITQSLIEQVIDLRVSVSNINCKLIEYTIPIIPD